MHRHPWLGSAAALLLLSACGSAASAPASPAASAAASPSAAAKPSSAASPAASAKPSAAGSAAASGKPGAALQPFTIAYSSPSLTEIPVFIAQQRGFFKDEGLDVQVPYFRGSAELTAGVVGGSIQVAYTTSEAVLSAASQGGIQPVFLTMTDDHYAYNVVAKPEIKTMEQLAGKVFSIGTGPGTNPDFALTAELEAHGMKADSVQRVTGGDTATRAAALEGGKVDATLLDPPYDLPTINKGFSVVASVTDDVKKPIAGALLWTRRDYATAHKDQMVAVAKGITRAVRFGKANPDETKKLITAWTKIEDKASLDRGYDFYFNKLLRSDPLPSADALQNSIVNAAQARKEEPKLKAQDFIDDSYVKQALQQLGG
jgi:NitT/TauT family transport system substrate-binding protein